MGARPTKPPIPTRLASLVDFNLVLITLVPPASIELFFPLLVCLQQKNIPFLTHTNAYTAYLLFCRAIELQTIPTTPYIRDRFKKAFVKTLCAQAQKEISTCLSIGHWMMEAPNCFKSIFLTTILSVNVSVSSVFELQVACHANSSKFKINAHYQEQQCRFSNFSSLIIDLPRSKK